MVAIESYMHACITIKAKPNILKILATYYKAIYSFLTFHPIFLIYIVTYYILPI